MVAEWLSNDPQLPCLADDLTVLEVIARFWTHAETFYRKVDGTPTSELDNFRQALRPLKALYADALVRGFGPRCLRTIQSEMIRLGWASYHRTRAVLALLEDHADHVLVIWLPRYSPELNLIEGLWGYLKRSSLNNYFFGDVKSLERAINDTFAHLNQQPQTTLSLAYHSATTLRKSA